MNVGLLKETRPGERRVALTPVSVRRLIEGHNRVLVEHGAGERSHFPDSGYLDAGAQIAFSAEEVIDRSELLVKVERPTPHEYSQLHPHQIVMAFFHMAVANEKEVHWSLEKFLSTVGYEIIESPDGRLPVLEPISEIAGQMAVAVAVHLLRSTSGGRGVLLGGAPGIPPARVAILGAGVVGTWAARTALAGGATTVVLDNDLAKLRRLHAQATGVVTMLADADLVRQAVRDSDVLIGAVLMHGERAPHLVTRDMVVEMKPGSVIIDVSIDQGGCIETSRPTTLDEPVFAYNGVLHYCVPNMTADIAHTASTALSQAVLPYVLELAASGADAAFQSKSDLAAGVYTHNGYCCHPPLADRWQLSFRSAS